MNKGSSTASTSRPGAAATANGRQIRESADRGIPVAAAIDLVDQPVTSFGVSSSVFAMTGSTSASVILRETPGHGPSHRPSNRRPSKRRPRTRTVSAVMPSRRATSANACPSALSGTILDLSTHDWAPERRRTHDGNIARSASDSTTGAIFGPGRLTPDQRRAHLPQAHLQEPKKNSYGDVENPWPVPSS